MRKSGRARPPLEKTHQSLREHLPELRVRYRVRSLGLFGSYVRGEQESGSDLDILVEYESSPTFFEFVGLEDHLSELVGVKVDLVMKSALKPRIGERILSELEPV
ncbi:MAG: nucleotidyltransferase family protein [bacterium]|nr:nucleotidyltransferase family protein [bacterium]